jgi:dihydroxy-acid dehydratase
VQEGDVVRIDVQQRLIEVEVSDETIRKRLAAWKPPKPRYAGGVFGKYCALVASASQGAITRPQW